MRLFCPTSYAYLISKKLLKIFHVSVPSSPQIQWESLKCVLRGILIKHGTHLKKEASFNLQGLLATLHLSDYP